MPEHGNIQHGDREQGDREQSDSKHGDRAVDCSALRVVFAGTPPFAAVSLEALLDSSLELVGVLTQPDRPAGRGRMVTPSAVKTLALEHGIPVQQPSSLRSAEAVAAIAALAPDVIVVVAYGLLLPAAVLNLPPLGCINVHASLLPRWRGAAPVQRAILAGDAETGIGYMRMDEGLDTGDVLASVRLPLDGKETGPVLTERLARLGATGLAALLGDWCRGDIVSTPQATSGVTHAAKVGKREAILDFAATAEELDRRIRAFAGWPVAETVLDGERVRVHASRLPAQTPAVMTSSPGTILSCDAESVSVMSGRGTIDLLQLQRPGGRVVDARTFAQGRDLAGRRFGQATDGADPA